MRIPNPCNRCSHIPVRSRCSVDFCLECPVFVEFFFDYVYEQMSFDESLPFKPFSFWEYELALVAKEREELLK